MSSTAGKDAAQPEGSDGTAVAVSPASRLGFTTGMVVQELGWDTDTDDSLRIAIEDAIDADMVDGDYGNVVDAVVLWWRADDGDLVDGLVDSLTDLVGGGPIWLLTPKVGRPGAVDPADTAEVGRDDAALRRVLERVQLGHLVGRLDEAADWTRILSPGEQQRLGFARILLAEPAIVFLDEATAAVDEGLENSLYRTLREALPESVIVSVGHRSTLDGFHDRILELRGGGRWAVTDRVR